MVSRAAWCEKLTQVMYLFYNLEPPIGFDI
jgi:hypothetical protein